MSAQVRDRVAARIETELDGRFLHGAGGDATTTRIGNTVHLTVAAPPVDKDSDPVVTRYRISVEEV